VGPLLKPEDTAAPGSVWSALRSRSARRRTRQRVRFPRHHGVVELTRLLLRL